MNEATWVVLCYVILCWVASIPTARRLAQHLPPPLSAAQIALVTISPFWLPGVVAYRIVAAYQGAKDARDAAPVRDGEPGDGQEGQGGVR